MRPAAPARPPPKNGFALDLIVVVTVLAAAFAVVVLASMPADVGLDPGFAATTTTAAATLEAVLTRVELAGVAVLGALSAEALWLRRPWVRPVFGAYAAWVFGSALAVFALPGLLRGDPVAAETATFCAAGVGIPCWLAWTHVRRVAAPSPPAAAP